MPAAKTSNYEALTVVANEALIMKRIHAAIGSRPDCRLWRCNVGRAVTERGQWMNFGLPGMADLAGILCVNGAGVALFIEVKSEHGRLSPQQQRFRQMVETFGACYIEARSVEDAVRGIDHFKTRFGGAEECRPGRTLNTPSRSGGA